MLRHSCHPLVRGCSTNAARSWRALMMKPDPAHTGAYSLQVEERSSEAPSNNEVQIQVQASSINPIDVEIWKGNFGNLVDPTSEPILGRDFAGVVTEVGPDVWNYAVGDEVVGLSLLSMGVGSHAELINIPESHITKRPSSWSPTKGASLGYVGFLAYHFASQRAQDGDNIFIHGGAGALGMKIVQYVRALRKNCVISVSCAEEYFERVMEFGGDQAVRESEVFERHNKKQSVDLMIDLKGEEDRLLPLLKEEGRYSHLHPPRNPLLAFKRQQTLSTQYQAQFRYEALDLIFNTNYLLSSASEHILPNMIRVADENRIQTDIHKIFPFHEAEKAYDYIERGHARGKIVLSME